MTSDGDAAATWRDAVFLVAVGAVLLAVTGPVGLFADDVLWVHDALDAGWADGPTGSTGAGVWSPVSRGWLALVGAVFGDAEWAWRVVFVLLEVAGVGSFVAALRSLGVAQRPSWLAGWAIVVAAGTTFPSTWISLTAYWWAIVGLCWAVVWAARRPWLAAVALAVAISSREWSLLAWAAIAWWVPGGRRLWPVWVLGLGVHAHAAEARPEHFLSGLHLAAPRRAWDAITALGIWPAVQVRWPGGEAPYATLAEQLRRPAFGAAIVAGWTAMLAMATPRQGRWAWLAAWAMVVVGHGLLGTMSQRHGWIAVVACVAIVALAFRAPEGGWRRAVLGGLTALTVCGWTVGWLQGQATCAQEAAMASARARRLGVQAWSTGAEVGPVRPGTCGLPSLWYHHAKRDLPEGVRVVPVASDDDVWFRVEAYEHPEGAPRDPMVK